MAEKKARYFRPAAELVPGLPVMFTAPLARGAHRGGPAGSSASLLTVLRSSRDSTPEAAQTRCDGWDAQFVCALSTQGIEGIADKGTEGETGHDCTEMYPPRYPCMTDPLSSCPPCPRT